VSGGSKPNTPCPEPGSQSGRVTRPPSARVYAPVTSDADLVARVRKGDTAAFAVLVARYRDRLGRYAVHMLGDRNDAEEALQDAFVRAYRSLHRCREDEHFGRWLFGILVNRCRTTGRRSARRNRTFVRDDVSLEQASTPEAPDPTEWEDAVRLAMQRLARPLREAFLLKHVEDMEYTEMSRFTGVGVSALKMRVLRAREQLRTLLSEVERV
jgi:RNA polymerase sigma-70 factor, ECF subfamily